MLRSCPWTPSHTSPATRWISCAVPATQQLGARLRGCKFSSGKLQKRPAQRSRKATSSWQPSRTTCRPDKPIVISVFVATYALQRRLAARRDLRREHELVVLDDLDAVTNLVMQTSPSTPSRAQLRRPLARRPRSTPPSPHSSTRAPHRRRRGRRARGHEPTTPPIHPFPSATPTAPGSAPAIHDDHPAHPSLPGHSTGPWPGAPRHP